MKISCPSCPATYNIPDEKIPAKGAKTKCKKCGGQIIIPPRTKDINIKQAPDVSVQPKVQETNNNVKTTNKDDNPNKINSEKIVQTADQIKNKATETASVLKNKSSEMYNNLSDKVDSEKIAQTTEQLKNKATETANVLKNKSSEAFGSLAKDKQYSLIITTGIVIFLAIIFINIDIKAFQFVLKFSILAFLVIMVMGCIKGGKEKLVIFYDKKDVFGSFMIVGSVVGLFIIVDIIDQFLFDGSILHSGSEPNSSSIGEIILGLSLICVSVYFLYRTISYSLLHNKGESNYDLMLAISAKVGTGIIYPIVAMVMISGAMNKEGTRAEKNNRNIILMLLAMAGGWLISILVNGEEVYVKRGWKAYVAPTLDEEDVLA